MPAATPLVCRRGGPRPHRLDPVDLSGSCPGQRHLLVSDRHPRAARPGRRPVRALRRPRARRPHMEEMAAILAAPDGSTWSGQRDRVLFALMYNTGVRVSEAIGLRRSDVELTPSRTVRINGKGRKQRVIPLWKSTADRLREWLPRIGQQPD